LQAISRPRLLLAALLIGMAGFLLAGSRAEAARSFTTGVIDVSAFEEGSDAAFDHAAESGAKIVKNNLSWNFVVANGESADRPGTEIHPFDATDPASPYYNWGTFDRIVRKAADRGLEAAFTIVNTPRWARDTCTDEAICSPKPADYADFAEAAASRYSGTFDPGGGEGILPRVRIWQAWVEPNLYLFYKPVFKPNGSPAAPYNYRRILNPFYEAIHSVNDSNTVIAGGLAPNAVAGKAIAPLDFTRRALCMGGTYRNPRPIAGCSSPVKADAWAVHPYTTGAPVHLPTDPDNMSVAALPRMQKALRLYLEAWERSDVLRHETIPGLDQTITWMAGYPVTEETRLLLLDYLEEKGRFDEAENLVLDWIEGESDESFTYAAGFYQRLLELEDAELIVGGLTRDEVRAGLDALG